MSGSKQAQKPVPPPREARTPGQHPRQKVGKKIWGVPLISSFNPCRKANKYGLGVWHGLWVGVALSWTDLRLEVSTGALGKSYTFSAVLIASL